MTMADDRTKTGAQDRSRVSASEGYEVSDFARKHGLSAEQARELIKQHGPNRERLDQAAQKLKGRMH
jgi:hypothetical protein